MGLNWSSFYFCFLILQKEVAFKGKTGRGCPYGEAAAQRRRHAELELLCVCR